MNPADASYCFFDGRLLMAEFQTGPLHLGTLPFAAPFYFSNQQACANFNQLALGCAHHWEEARRLLADGTWLKFFAHMGRIDLAAAAEEAGKNPDPDRGLSQFLERLPADPDCLRPAKLAVASRKEDLGDLTPGMDKNFEVVILNQGTLLMCGVASTTCDWLAFNDNGGPHQRLFQTRDSFSLVVYVLGSGLRAGIRPLEGEIILETNGGTMTVQVRANVPVRPFPNDVYGNNVLTGAMSPREIAIRAKEQPGAAATLFEQGAVKAWYSSNGWSYPIEGTEGSGKGAVQQFFEALGLTKPPRLQIDTDSLRLKGKSGERLSKRVTVSTEEDRPVYAQAWSSEQWVKVASSRYHGKKVTIPLEIVVPPRPGETLDAKVNIRGNGKQQFDVLVSLAVEKDSPAVVNKPLPAAASANALVEQTGARAAVQDGSPASWWWLVWVGWLAAGFFGAGFLLLIAGLVLGIL